MTTEHMTPAGTKPLGPVAAVFYAAGIGSIVLGLLTVLAETNESIKDALQLSDPVGPLSGKTVFAVIAFLIVWGLLHLVMRGKDPSARKVFAWTGLMVGIGVVLTFPTLFQAFAG
jgi:cytosine/uracil/thiamine/allantoin permease